MTDPIADLKVRQGRHAAVRLAWVAMLTAILWSIGADQLYHGFTQLAALPACTARECWSRVALGALPALGTGLVLALAGFGALLAWGIPAVRGAFLRSVAVVRRNRQARAARAIILTLSDLKRPDELDLANRAVARAAEAAADDQRSRVLDALCDPQGPWKGWRWQQPLRLLRHNQSRLEVMVFVLTREAAPQYADHFHSLLRALNPKLNIRPDPTSMTESGWVNHSDYNEVTAALDAACEGALDTTRCLPSEICIDITSGTKAWSAAATVKTLNSRAVFSYVETEAPYDVVTYDASLTA